MTESTYEISMLGMSKLHNFLTIGAVELNYLDPNERLNYVVATKQEGVVNLTITLKTESGANPFLLVKTCEDAKDYDCHISQDEVLDALSGTKPQKTEYPVFMLSKKEHDG